MQAQSDTTLARKASSRMLKRLGKNAFKQGDPSSAITFFEAYLKRHKQKVNPDVTYKLGLAYMQIRDYKRAQQAFIKSYNASKNSKTGKSKNTEALYYYALMQKSNNQYDSAKANFTTFKKQYKVGDKVLKKQATKEIAFCDSVHKIEKERKKVSVYRLDTTINKVNTEASPTQLDDYTMIFTSLRTEKKEVIGDEDTGNVITRKMYYANKKNGKWKFAGEYGATINQKKINTGNACLSPDKKRMYFTRCATDYRGKMICAIYVSEKNGEEWSEPVKLPKSINHPRYTATMPAVTIDPLKGNDIIYFVSDRKKSKGKLDIWYTVYNKKTKTYRDPKNAGTKINTTQNEISPFFDRETQSLYFSSDGMGGLGGYDIFKATGDGKRWMSVDNIGQPINTGADELYYTISDNRREGFFVSNRSGGNTLKNATCCDDIYNYFNNEYIDIKYTGNVTEGNDPFEPIPNAKIELYLKDPLTKEKLLIKTIEADSKGRYSLNVEAGQDFEVVVRKNDYLSTTYEISSRNITTSKNIEKDFQLKKRPKEIINMPYVQYEFGSDKLTKASEANLDSTILNLLLLNPELIIEVYSHTDSKGSDKFNLKLSQKRAESVVFYLLKKGIAQNRMKATGLGETKPIAPNENPDGSDNPEGRAKNRRTNFKIIGTIENTDVKDE